MSRQKLGKVSVTVRGTYDSSFSYERLDIVEKNGSSYIAKIDNRGIDVTNKETWMLLCQKPIKGTDYFDENDKKEIVDKVTELAESDFNIFYDDKILDFNNNAKTQKDSFDNNVTDKTNKFNKNYEDKLSSFNSNANSSTTSFNDNAENKTIEFNDSVTDKTTEFNENYSAKLTDFNTNSANKTTSFNTNASDKLKEYNDNASSKYTAFDTNYSEKLEAFNDNANSSTNAFNTNANNKTEEFNNNVDSIRKDINDNTKRIKRIEEDLFDSGEASDTFIHVEDSTYTEAQEIEIEGVAKQTITEGKQLVDFANGFGYIATFSFKNDVLTVTSSEPYGYNRVQYDILSILKANPSKILSFDYDSLNLEHFNSSSKSLILLKVVIDGQAKYIDILTTLEAKNGYTIPEETSKISEALLLIYANNRPDFSASTLIINKPIFHFGENKVEYEEYSGRESSPRPQWKQPILVIDKPFKLATCNKNVFDINNFTFTDSTKVKISIYGEEITITTVGENVNRDLFVKTKIDDIFLKNGQIYTISSENVSGVVKNLKLQLRNKDGSPANLPSSNSVTYDDKYSLYVVENIFSNLADEIIPNGTVAKIKNIQVQIGSSVTSFEEHQESELNIPVPAGEFYAKLSDTEKDNLVAKFNKEDSHYHLYLEKNIKRIILDGTQPIGHVGIDRFNTHLIVQIIQDDMKKDNRNILKSDFWKYSFQNWDKDEESICVGGPLSDRFQMKIKLTELSSSDIAGIKQWLSEKKPIVYYPITEPYEVDLGVIEMPLTYRKVTNAFTDSELQPKIKLKYYRDIKQTIKVMQDDIANLKASLSLINEVSTMSEIPTQIEESEVVENDLREE